MSLLFYYQQLFDAAVDRMNRLVNTPASLTNSLMITTEDIDQVAQKIIHSLGTALCPHAPAEFAGTAQLLEKDLSNNQ